MSKPLGSELFNTTNIRVEEGLLLLKVMRDSGMDLEHSMLDIEFIDDILALQKIESLITNNRYTATGRVRKNSSLIDIIDRRVDQLVKEDKELF